MFGGKKTSSATSNSKKKQETNRSASEVVEDRWDAVCDWIEHHGGSLGSFISKHVLRRLTIEAPVVVGFCWCCVTLHILNVTVFPGISAYFGVKDTFEMFSVMQYVRLFTHIFGHDGLQHLKNNMVNLLLVGPSCEHAFGSSELLVVFAVVAVASALAHILLGHVHTYQLGASGVCFALILLNSLIAAKYGKIPVSFVLTAFLWTSDEIFKLFFGNDRVSHHAHLTGAIVGVTAGYMLHKRRQQEQVESIARRWWVGVSSSTKKKAS